MRKGQGKGQLLEPIVRWEPAGDGEVLLMDTRALMLHLGISDRTVRRYRAHRVKDDEKTGAPLYDALKIGADRKRLDEAKAKARSGRAARVCGGQMAS